MNNVLFRLFVSCLVTVALLAPLNLPLQAQPISTGEALAAESGSDALATIDAWLAREDAGGSVRRAVRAYAASMAAGVLIIGVVIVLVATLGQPAGA
jgi:Na+/phosphate symporter